MQATWETDPDNRPTFKAIRSRLNQMLRKWKTFIFYIFKFSISRPHLSCDITNSSPGNSSVSASGVYSEPLPCSSTTELPSDVFTAYQLPRGTSNQCVSSTDHPSSDSGDQCASNTNHPPFGSGDQCASTMNHNLPASGEQRTTASNRYTGDPVAITIETALWNSYSCS